MSSLDRRVKGAREWEGEQQAAASDVPGSVPSSPLIQSIAEVTYEDPEAPGRETSRWLVTLEHTEPLIQRKTYIYAVKDGVHGQDRTDVPAYTVTQRFLANGQSNPDCDQAIDDTTCKAFNPNCLEKPGATDGTCEVFWPVEVDAATWFALSAEPLCEYTLEHTDEELFELLEHHSLPECLESATEALDLEDVVDLEKLRLSLNEALNDEAVQTSLEVDRTSVELLWASTTQSIGMPLQKARADLYRGVIPVPATVSGLSQSATAATLPHVASAYSGTLRAPDLRDPEGLLLDVFGPGVPTHEVPLLVALPAASAECTPPFQVALLAHGLGSDKSDLWGVADALGAECLATLALDLPGHGAHPIAELWSDDPFLITGNLQQGAVELMQAVRALEELTGGGTLEQALAAAGAGAELLNGDQPGLVAGSLGAFIGAAVMAVDPSIQHAVLSAVAGDWPELLPGLEDAGHLPAGSTEALQAWRLDLGPRAIDVTGWVMERMDPAALVRQYRYRRFHEFKDLLRYPSDVPMKDKRVLIQAPMADTVLPAGATATLARSWGADDPETIVELSELSGAHRVLFDDGAGHALAAAQAARFLASSGTEVLTAVKR